MAETLGKLIDQLFTVDHKLWNCEDIAQTDGAGDHTVAEAKRKISILNLQRNRLIEEIDVMATEIAGGKAPAIFLQLKSYGKK
jgi:hypothetical protein